MMTAVLYIAEFFEFFQTQYLINCLFQSSDLKGQEVMPKFGLLERVVCNSPR